MLNTSNERFSVSVPVYDRTVNSQILPNIEYFTNIPESHQSKYLKVDIDILVFTRLYYTV